MVGSAVGSAVGWLGPVVGATEGRAVLPEFTLVKLYMYLVPMKLLLQSVILSSG